MAPAKGRGRKPAKSERAATLLSALKFVSVIKTPTVTSMPYNSYVWLNTGMAVAFDGIVAAGHPIDNDLQGYPHIKLLTEALENTNKQFDLTVRENGMFEITSDKYQALVPSLAYDQVVPTPPDANVAPLTPAFLAALEGAAKVVSDTAENVLHASVRLNGETILATDNATIVETWHGNYMPSGVVLPKQFVTSVVKTGKTPIGFGLGINWDTFTVWFDDGSWVRTATYPAETWPDNIINSFHGLMQAPPAVEIPAAMWKAVDAVLPFAGENNRIIFRSGLVRTHPDRRQGAAIEVADVLFDLDIDGKRLKAVEPLATKFSVGTFGKDGRTFVFYGTIARGVIAGLSPLPDPEPERDEPPATGGWTSEPATVDATGAPAAPWAMTQQLAPPPEEGQQEAAPAPSGGWGEPETKPAPAGTGWAGIPAGGLAGDPEYEAERQGLPAQGGWGSDDAAPEEDTPDDAPEVENDLGAGFNAGAWLDSIRDENE